MSYQHAFGLIARTSPNTMICLPATEQALRPATALKSIDGSGCL